jgi:hypothetical protein
LHPATADLLALAPEGDPHTPLAVGVVVALVDLLDLREHSLVLE